MVLSLPTSLISTHTRNNRRTRVWVEIMCIYGKKKSNNNKSPSISPSSQPVIMRQFQWLCLAGDISKGVRTVERHWPKRKDAERADILSESILDLPYGPSSYHPFKLQSPPSLQRSFLNFAQMQSLPESFPWSAPAAYAFLVMSHFLMLSPITFCLTSIMFEYLPYGTHC